MDAGPLESVDLTQQGFRLMVLLMARPDINCAQSATVGGADLLAVAGNPIAASATQPRRANLSAIGASDDCANCPAWANRFRLNLVQ